MRFLRLLAAAAALTMAGAPSAADTVCRPTELGTLRCAGPAVRPEPRPVYRSDVQALDRVRQAAEAAERDDDRFVPARDTDRLGGAAITDRPVAGPCRPDRLGNLHCR
jgi:hypothetical protein